MSKPLPIIQTSSRVPVSSTEDNVIDVSALSAVVSEFLYGIPPFHAEMPQKVFENVLSGHIGWHKEFIDFFPEALGFMQTVTQYGSVSTS